MHQGRESLTNRLQRQLAQLDSYLSIAGQNNRSSSHVSAETTAAGLLNRIYGWELENANVIQQNYPGVDLIDGKRNIAVQVTANRTLDKVRGTLEKVSKGNAVYELLIVLMLTHEKPTPAMKKCTVAGYSGRMEVWNLADLFRVAAELDAAKLAELTDFLEEELGSIALKTGEETLELPASSILEGSGFVGRGEELKEIRRRFDARDHLVVLSGLGGMGKTELAIRYAQDHPGRVYFTRFDRSFTRTLASMAQGIRPEISEEDLRLEPGILCKRVLEILKKADPGDLLIIDNVDSDTNTLQQLQQDYWYTELSKLRIHLLLTTRSPFPRAIPVRPMAEEPLFEIFENHGAGLDREQMRALIRAVNGHTLTVDLIARTLVDNWVPVSVEEVLDAIANSARWDEDFPEVGTDYNQDPEQLHIYARLRGVFRVANIPPAEQQILSCATLLPEAGMDTQLFRSALTREQHTPFRTLGDRGWFLAEQQRLSIHPVIRLVCRTELAPGGADCAAFLDRLWAQYDQKKYNYTRYTQMAELFTLAYDRLRDPDCRWLNRSGILWNDLRQPQVLHDLYHSRLPELERLLPPDSPELATAYNYYGIALGDMGQYMSALTYSEKALTIRQAVLPEDDAYLARSYTNVGVIYGYLGELRKSLEYKLKALEIFKKALPQDHPDLATSCGHVGSSYSSLGHYETALGYFLATLDICERALDPKHPERARAYLGVSNAYGRLGNYQKAFSYAQTAQMLIEETLPPNHPDLAEFYNGMEAAYDDLGDIQKSLEYSKRSLEIRKKTLPQEHPDLADSYERVGVSYGKLHDYHKSKEYQQKALKIREKIFPPEHTALAWSNSNLGQLYSLMGEHRKALNYQQKALAIREKALPPEHPDLAVSYGEMGGVYSDLRDFPMALKYGLKALEMKNKIFPPEHPELAASYNDVGGIYAASGKNEKALEYAMKALEIFEKAFRPDHPALATSYSNIAYTYHEQGDLPNAARYMRQAADVISRSSLPEDHPQKAEYPRRAAEYEQEAAAAQAAVTKMQQDMLSRLQQLPAGPFPFPKK